MCRHGPHCAKTTPVGAELARDGITAVEQADHAVCIASKLGSYIELITRELTMKITKLTTFIVPPRWLFLKIETDEGVTGWGEPVVEGRAHTVAAAVDELSDYLIGKDPRNIEDIWTVRSEERRVGKEGGWAVGEA